MTYESQNGRYRKQSTPEIPKNEHLLSPSRGRPKLTFKGRHSDVDPGRPKDVLRMSSRGTSKHPNLDVPKFLLSFLSELILLTKSI